jgi:hypothetical protein
MNPYICEICLFQMHGFRFSACIYHVYFWLGQNEFSEPIRKDILGHSLPSSQQSLDMSTINNCLFIYMWYIMFRHMKDLSFHLLLKVFHGHGLMLFIYL